MSEANPNPDLARIARQHLESLRRAGVAWLPTAPPPTPNPSSEAPPQQTTLSEELAPADGPTVLTPEQRRVALTVLAQTVAGCMRCAELASTRTQTVFGVGPIDADLGFVGEAPGFDEDKKGEPFVGAAGQLLNRIIAAMGLKREDVFICNILRCRPPNNRQPLATEAASCREYLEQTLELVRPKVLCALGGSATKYLLSSTIGITKLRGQWMEFKGIPVMCTYHPSYLLRLTGTSQENAKREVWDDMKAVLRRLGRPIPGGK